METVQTNTKVHYKYCIVPMCPNTTVTAPDKHYFTVPKDKKKRAKWCKVMKRIVSLSEKSVRYCCEDHFNVEEDTENFMRHRFIGGRLFLKKNVLPHKFACQRPKPEVQERSAVAKRRRIEFYSRVLSMEVPVSVAQQPPEFIECIRTDEEKVLDHPIISQRIDILHKDRQGRLIGPLTARNFFLVVFRSQSGKDAEVCHTKVQKLFNKKEKKDGVTYYRFPGDEIMREEWRKLVARERSDEFYKPHKSSVVCSDHFLESDFYYAIKGKYKLLTKTAIPLIQFADDAGLSQSRIGCREEAESSAQLQPSYELDTDDVNTLTEYAGPSTSRNISQVGSTHQDESTLGSTPGTGAASDESMSNDDNDGESMSHEGFASFACNVCSGPIVGFRYRCCECHDYDMCGGCEARGVHPHHFVLRVPHGRAKATTATVMSAVRVALATENDVEEIKIKVKEEVEVKPDPLAEDDALEENEALAEDEAVAPAHSKAVTESGISFVFPSHSTKKRIGPKIDPCETPIKRTEDKRSRPDVSKKVKKKGETNKWKSSLSNLDYAKDDVNEIVEVYNRDGSMKSSAKRKPPDHALQKDSGKQKRSRYNILKVGTSIRK